MDTSDVTKRRLILRAMLNALDDDHEDDYWAGYSALVEMEQEIGEFDEPELIIMSQSEAQLAAEVALFLTDEPDGGGPHAKAQAHETPPAGPVAGTSGSPCSVAGPAEPGDG